MFLDGDVRAYFYIRRILGIVEIDETVPTIPQLNYNTRTKDLQYSKSDSFTSHPLRLGQKLPNISINFLILSVHKIRQMRTLCTLYNKKMENIHKFRNDIGRICLYGLCNLGIDKKGQGVLYCVCNLPVFEEALMGDQEKTLYPSKYNKFRLKNMTHNTSADDFVFVRSVIRNSLDPVVPLMAGVTQADPSYFIDLRNRGFDKRRLIVMEYVVSGSGHITYNGITKKVSQGDFYLLNSEFNGSYRSDLKDPYVKKWVNLDGQLAPALLKAFGVKNQVLILRMDVEKYFDRILEILSRYNEASPWEDDLEISHVLVDVFDQIRRCLEAQKKDVRSANIGEIVRFIDANLLQGDISVEFLSESFYVSRRTMHRMFMKEFGIPPLKYITGKKIEMAQRMLGEDLPVEEVARLLFFSNPEYFRKVFVSVAGMSPQKYKKQMQKKT